MIRLDIWNDGTGTRKVGNYAVEMTLPSETVQGRIIRVRTRVSDFSREERVYALMRLAVDALEEAKS